MRVRKMSSKMRFSNNFQYHSKLIDYSPNWVLPAHIYIHKIHIHIHTYAYNRKHKKYFGN